MTFTIWKEGTQQLLAVINIVIIRKKKYEAGWLSRYQHLLVLRRTWVWVPTPTSDGLQLLLTPVSGDATPSSSLPGNYINGVGKTQI